MATNESTPQKVTLSFKSKSKKVNSSLTLRQQSISKPRDNESKLGKSVTNITDNLSNHTDTDSDKSKPQIIIPLIKHNKWRKPKTNPPPLESESESETQTKLNSEQQKAIDIIADSLSLSNNESNPKSALNQMYYNRVPGIEDVNDAKKRIDIDIAQRPKAPQMSEYTNIPLLSFGKAMLCGMGWDSQTPIGKPYGNNQLKLPKTFSAKPRPKLLGFGARLTETEAQTLIRKKFNPRKQRTESELKRIRNIQSFTEQSSANEPSKKKRKIESIHSNERNERKIEKIKWVRNGLKVRCLKKGKYFRVKGSVNDVIDEHRFEVQMNSDHSLLTLYECEAETVIPKKGGNLLILSGEHRKEKGRLLNRNKHKQCATVQLQNDLSIVTCHFDDICAI